MFNQKVEATCFAIPVGEVKSCPSFSIWSISVVRSALVEKNFTAFPTTVGSRGGEFDLFDLEWSGQHLP